MLSYVVRGYTGGELVAENTVDGLEATMPAAEEYRVAALNAPAPSEQRGADPSSPRGSTSSARTGSSSKTTRYTAAFTPADTTYQDVTWSVTDPQGAPTYIADIDAGGC